MYVGKPSPSRPKLVTTMQFVEKDGKTVAVEYVAEEDKEVWKIKYAEHSERIKQYNRSCPLLCLFFTLFPKILLPREVLEVRLEIGSVSWVVFMEFI